MPQSTTIRSQNWSNSKPKNSCISSNKQTSNEWSRQNRKKVLRKNQQKIWFKSKEIERKITFPKNNMKSSISTVEKILWISLWWWSFVLIVIHPRQLPLLKIVKNQKRIQTHQKQKSIKQKGKKSIKLKLSKYQLKAFKYEILKVYEEVILNNKFYIDSFRRSEWLRKKFRQTQLHEYVFRFFLTYWLPKWVESHLRHHEINQSDDCLYWPP